MTTPTRAEDAAGWGSHGDVDGHRPAHHTATAATTSTRPIELVLGRLERVEQRGAGEWRASCPTDAHHRGDRSRGLCVSELPDHRVLVHCYAGCPVDDVMVAIGLELADLFPADGRSSRGRGRGPHLSARDALEMIEHPCWVVLAAAEDTAAGCVLSTDDRAALARAVEQIRTVVAAAGVRSR